MSRSKWPNPEIAQCRNVESARKSNQNAPFEQVLRYICRHTPLSVCFPTPF